MRIPAVTTAAVTALLIGATPTAFSQPQTGQTQPTQAQPAQPPAAQTQPGQPAQGGFTRAETPGRPAVPAGQDYSQTMERLFQAAQRLRESVQAAAQQPAGERRNQAMAQAREALMHTQQAMAQLPPELRTSQNFREADRRVAEARAAIEAPQPDPQRAQAAMDAYLVLVPRLQADAAALPPATAAGAPAVGAPPVVGGGPVAAGAVVPGIPLQRISSLMGTDLIGPGGEKVAEIENFLLDRDGNVRAVVVEWGGFLGIGDREALVPMDRIQLGAAANDRARISLTREQLEALPRFDRNRLADYGREYGWGEGLRWYR